MLFSEDQTCTITERKCEFPFPHDGTDETQCIPLSEKDLGGMKVDEDAYYCMQTDSKRQKFPSWGQCNDACFISPGSEFHISVTVILRIHYITAPNPGPFPILPDPVVYAPELPSLFAGCKNIPVECDFPFIYSGKKSTHFLIIPFLRSYLMMTLPIDTIGICC